MINDQITNGRGRTARRGLALALCVLFAAASVHAAIFVAANDGHTHTDHAGHSDGACLVCAHLTAAGSLLKSLSSPAADTPRVRVSSFVDSDVSEFAVSYYSGNNTPVNLKVKLNN